MRITSLVLVLALALLGCGGQVGQTGDGTRERSSYNPNTSIFFRPVLYWDDYPAPHHQGWVHVTGWGFAAGESLEIDTVQLPDWSIPYTSDFTNATPTGDIDLWIYHQFPTLLAGKPVSMTAYTPNNGPYYDHVTTVFGTP